MTSQTASKRSNRLAIQQACSQCLQIPDRADVLLKCSKCKTALYCSRECQKLHWPDHKKQCVEASEISAAIFRLLKNFVAEPQLMALLQVAFAHDFRLDMFPSPNRRMFGECVLVVQPFDVGKHLQFLDARSRGESMEGSEWSTKGVLQMKAFLPMPGHVMSNVLKNIWDEMKTQAREGDHAAVLHLIVEGCDPIGTYTGILIPRETIEGVRGKQPVLIHQGYPDIDFPPSSQNCIKAINLLISKDMKNKMRLRTSFTQETALKLNEDWQLLDYTPSL